MKMPITDLKFACIVYLVQQEAAELEIDWLHPCVQAFGEQAYGDVRAFTYQTEQAKEMGQRIRKRRKRLLVPLREHFIRETDGELVKRTYRELDDSQVEVNDCVVISEGRVPLVLQLYHDNQGHPGMNKTFAAFRDFYSGISLEMTRDYVHACEGCNHIYVPPKYYYTPKKIKIELPDHSSAETDDVIEVWVDGGLDGEDGELDGMDGGLDGEDGELDGVDDDLMESSTASESIEVITETEQNALPTREDRNILPGVQSLRTVQVQIINNPGQIATVEKNDEGEYSDIATDVQGTINSSTGVTSQRFVTINRSVPAVASDVTIENVTRRPVSPRRGLVSSEHSYYTEEGDEDDEYEEAMSRPDRDLVICLRDQPHSTTAMKWTDFYGVDEAKQRLEEYVIWPKKYPALFKDIRFNKGVLLHGCSGSGKTSLVQSLGIKAQCKLYAISSHLLVRDSMIDTMRAVQFLFCMAKERVRAIVFIDDLERLTNITNTSPQSPGNGVLRMLEEQLENLVHNTNVYIICATSSLEALSESLLNKLQQVKVQLPDESARKCILEKWLTNAQPYRDLVDKVVQHTEGFTGDNMAALAREILLGRARSSILKQSTSPDDVIASAITRIKR